MLLEQGSLESTEARTPLRPDCGSDAGSERRPFPITFAKPSDSTLRWPKGADFLLKLGMSFANAGQKDNACRTFLRLDRDYPQAPSEIKDRSGAEKKRLSCAA